MNRAQRRQAARQNRSGGTPKAAAALVPAGPAAPGVQSDLDRAVRLQQAGNFIQAAEIYQRILEVVPDHAEATNYLGAAAGELGQFDTAVKLIIRSIELRPGEAVFHNNLGNVLNKAGRFEAAANAYEQAVKADAKFAAAWNNLGMALAVQFKDDDSIRAFERAIRVKPDFAEAHNNLGNIHYTRKQFHEAEKSYQCAIRIRPDYATVYNNLGVTLSHMDRPTEAEAANRRAIALQPDYPAAFNNLGGVLHNQGRLAEACDAYRRSVELDPDGSGAHSNLIFSMGLDYNVTAGEILAECRNWNQLHGVPRAAAVQRLENDRDPDRRLRVGYVSADFRDHAVAYFAEPLFAAHDHAAFEIFAYADVPVPDHVSARFESSADCWVPIAGMSSTDVAARIRADGIDILIDLSGHTGGNWLLSFAEKPAPLQASWLGYGGTTGLDAMDYRISDAVTDPAGMADTQHTEKLVRLPDAFLCYQPPSSAPEVKPSPAAQGGYVTFASFNNFSKVVPQAVTAWARLLKAVPGARMIIKGRAFAEAEIRRIYLDIFAAEEVGGDRVELIAQLSSRQDYMAIYDRVDIVLDTFPYNGATTTCEALWMGVPVVTLRGERTVSRMGASMLAQVGLSDLAADSEADYVAIAARLAGDPDRLAELRVGLRSRMADSPLCDAAAFARNMEAAYRDMWRRWCAGETVEGTRDAG